VVPFFLPGETAVADNLTPDHRRKTMQAVKGRDTSLERVVGSALHRLGLRYRRCVAALPGKPDFVFAGARVVVFVDGSWWHGWRFPQWKDRIGEYWRQKIERNRKRDRKNFRRLRRLGWTVVRFWDHQVQRDLDAVVARIAGLVGKPVCQEGQDSAAGRPSAVIPKSHPRIQVYRPSPRGKRRAGQADEPPADSPAPSRPANGS
jgi:DNA mismatch endonuclease (patch repair protein)